jgi:peptidoglycan hydrolase FlgJ
VSINPLSDIVLDVACAAEPDRLAAGQARLAQGADIAVSAARSGFDSVSQAISRQKPPIQVTWAAAANIRAEPPDGLDPRAAAWRGLEQVLLTQMIELMLPSPSSAAFGGGTAGFMWRGMLAQEAARVMAKGRGVGIAAELAAHSPAAGTLRNALGGG